MLGLLLKITDYNIFNLFIFSLKLLKIKPLLLAEAKLTNMAHLIEYKKLHPLSLGYDEAGKHGAYYNRVQGALLSFFFFDKLDNSETNFISAKTEHYIKDFLSEYQILKDNKVEANQMFMLMFSESINQSITSKAGSSYEERIFDILISLKIPKENIRKIHDENDKSTEYDFFFNIDNESYGISAKRTLRERYKQFIHTNHTTKIDVKIEITLGLDLSKNTAQTIRQHDTYLFVADEIYNSREYLREIAGIFPASELSLETLKKL